MKGDRMDYGGDFSSGKNQPPPYDASPAKDGPASVGEFGERFPQAKKYNDSIWAVVFCIQFVILMGISVYYIAKNHSAETSGSFSVGGDEVLLIAVTFLAGIVTSSLSLYIIRSCASCLIWTTLILGLVSTAFMAIVLFYTTIVFGVLFMLLFLFQLFYVYSVRNHVPFASALLETSVDVIKRYPSTVGITFIAIILQAIWSAVFLAGAMFAYVDIVVSSQDSALADVAFVYFVFSFYWTTSTVLYWVYTVVNGVVGEWYFRSSTNGTSEVPPNVSIRCMKRASTTSFGSICLGALLIAVIKTLRYFAQRARRESSNDSVIACVCSCIAVCILSCLEGILELFNSFAYVYVAIYGFDYCTAGKNTIEMLKSRGFDLIINDNLIEGVLFFMSVFGGFVVAAITYVASHIVYDSEAFTFLSILGFIIGFSICIGALQSISSSVSTLIICFAEDPFILQSTKPAVYEKLVSTFNKRYPELTQSFIGRRV